MNFVSKVMEKTIKACLHIIKAREHFDNPRMLLTHAHFDSVCAFS